MNEERIALLNKFIEEEPGNPFNKYALAMEYYDSQREKSLQILEKLIEDQPDYLPSYYKAAHLLWELEEWKKADVFFQSGIKIAEQQNNHKILRELKSAYQNFQFEMD